MSGESCLPADPGSYDGGAPPQASRFLPRPDPGWANPVHHPLIGPRVPESPWARTINPPGIAGPCPGGNPALQTRCRPASTAREAGAGLFSGSPREGATSRGQGSRPVFHARRDHITWAGLSGAGCPTAGRGRDHGEATEPVFPVAEPGRSHRTRTGADPGTREFPDTRPAGNPGRTPASGKGLYDRVGPPRCCGVPTDQLFS